MALIGSSENHSSFNTLLHMSARMDRVGMALLRCALALVLVWIGGLKFVPYEADSIVPLVANSPALHVFYQDAGNYKAHVNKEGELVPSHRTWHYSNGTYRFSYGLGIVIVLIGLLIALYPLSPRLSMLGSFLLILMSLTTLSFLFTTPEAWVPALGDQQHGFPYLSGVGRLIIKDTIMLASAVVTLADAARETLRQQKSEA